VRRRTRALADTAVLAAMALWATPFFWQLLTSFKTDAELVRLPPLLPTTLTLAGD
jgi:ABC-type glycerol-3-phosphate transport system permease component